MAYANRHKIIAGYITSVDFSFGLQARSKLHLKNIVDIETAILTVKYRYDGNVIRKDTYTLPIDYPYSIENPYVIKTKQNGKIVYRPVNTYATGTLTEDSTINENTEIAAVQENDIVTLYSVSEIEQDESVVIIG